ncbi:MAG: beta-propeller fold lactonase family protein, partial [Bryocella sp.]
MKLKNLGRAGLATALTLAIGFGATACSRDYTVAYAYAISKGTGSIAAYGVDYQSGALTQIAGSPFTGNNSGGSGSQPVVLVASPSGRNLYVVDNNYQNVSVYSVGTDGKIYGVATPSLIGSYPTAAAIDSTGCYLYVTVKLQPGYTIAAPGKGGIDIFPINTTGCSGATADDGSLRAGTLVPVGNNPISIAVSLPAANIVYVYVVDQENAPVQAQQPEPNTPSTTVPQVLGFTQNATTGALTLATGSTCTTTASIPCLGYAVGTGPSAIGIEPTARFVYVTDALSN